MSIQSATVEQIYKDGLTGKSGKIYRVESEFSIARKKVFDKWLIEFQSGFSPEKIVKEWDTVIAMLNKFQMADAIHKLVEDRNSVKKIEHRTDLLLKLCCLFLTSSDEDVTTFSETIVTDKAKDLEHYSYNTFFLLFLRTLPGLLANSEQDTQSISE
jgi:hypothetical protein